jgi:hypothetical protein
MLDGFSVGEKLKDRSSKSMCETKRGVAGGWWTGEGEDINEKVRSF